MAFKFLPFLFFTILVLPSGLVLGYKPDDHNGTFTITQPTLYHGRTRRQISTTKITGGHLPSVRLTVPAGGEMLVLDLELNVDLVPADHALLYQEGGDTVTHKPTKEDLCYYHGIVRGKPNSWASVSTCGGVSGLIFDGTTIRHIEPTEGPGIRSKHFLYDREDLYSISHLRGTSKEANSSLKIATRTLTANKYKRSTRKASLTYNANKDTRYVELVLVADHDVYKMNDRDTSRIHRMFIQAANILNSAYTAVNIRIALVGVVVWNEENEIDIVKDKEGRTLKNFASYRQDILRHRIPHDNAQLITKYSGGGLGYLGGMCWPKWSVATVRYTTDLPNMAGRMGHEMGHNLGMDHDDDFRRKNITCECPDEKCIQSGLGKMRFSTCSLKSLDKWMKSGQDSCLRNKPEHLFSPTCGDGFLQPGEECDCGVVPPSGELTPCHSTCDITEQPMLRFAHARLYYTTCKLLVCSVCDMNTCKLKRTETEYNHMENRL